MTSRFEKFSEHARHVLSMAQEEAQRFNHNYIGTEHILLGLIRETDSEAVRMLSNLNVELSKVRSAVEFIIGQGDRAPSGEIGLTPRSKKVIELAVDESRRLDHHYIGTEHLLIGLMREGEGVAAGVLESLGVTLDGLRNLVRTEESVGRETQAGADRPMTSRFDKFSEHARRVLSLAQEEAQRFNHSYIGTEHILLGLARETGSEAVRMLSDLNIEMSKVRSAVEVIIGQGDRAPSGEIGLTPRSKKVIELAVDESRRLDHHYIGTNHLLIGLMREKEGVAAGVLGDLGVTLEGLRNIVPQEESAREQSFTGVDRPMTATATDTRRRAANRVAGLYVIVDPQLTNGRDVVDVARAALRGGATAIQLRDKLHDKGDQLPVARALRDLCEQHNASFIVNDHADLAVASNAHGLHVGRHDLPVPEARAILHAHQFIGTSNALLEEALESIGQQADYIAVGAMYATDSKDNTRPAGVEALRRVRASVTDIPIVAIGGINLSNIDPILEAGADGICVIGAVCQADDPEDAARQLVQRITAARTDR